MSKIKVLHVKPKERPQRKEVEEAQQQLEQELGGSVEIKTPFDDKNVVLICNAYANFTKQKFNRALFGDNKLRTITEIILGTFLVAGIDENCYYVSLTKQQIEKYFARFQKGENFLLDESGILRVARYDIKDVSDGTSQ